jgi:VWFA-related protein
MDSSQNKEGQEELRHEVSVTLKLVQVYVTDKAGMPITDLEKSDFDLYDNGKRRVITDFERHTLSLPCDMSTMTQAEKEVPSAELMNRKFFLFFDFAFNTVGGITMAKQAALHFVNTQVNPTDEVAVFSYSIYRGLFFHEYLTRDHAKIREIIQQIGSSEALGRAGQLIDEIMGGVRWGGDPISKPESKNQARLFSSAMKDLANALRYIPGYKHIILFSIGIPSFMIYPRPGSIRPQMNTMNLDLSDSLDIRIRYEKMIREMKASNSPVYAVNVEGLHSDFMDREGESFISRMITKKPRASDPEMAEWDMRGDNSLKELAKTSGGKYYGDINDYEKIVEDIQNLTSSYYVLGYYIDEKWDGKYHKVKVNVKRRGCTVYGQGGYFNPKPFKKFSALEKKLHLVDLALSQRPHFGEPIEFPLVTLPYSAAGVGKIMMLSRITAEEKKKIIGEKSEIVLLIFNEKKDIVSFQRIEAGDERFPSEDVFFYATTSLSPGNYDLRLVMRNLENGKGAVASSSIVIPETIDSGLRLYPPLLLTPEKKGMYIETTSDSSLIDIYPFDPTLYKPLVGVLKRGAPNILVMIRCSVFNIPKAKVTLYARLVHQQTGNMIPLSLSSESTHQGDTLIFSQELKTHDLPPGKYYLYFFATETHTQAKAHTNTAFAVE